ncbi:hypothetical protein ACGFX4_02260 [Kitasatospora sp. NPDC048365]|uniref:hypothetical protein n=1 Tax=Kitasatospora sp. NPDC048365 TaxID=3364050 RepID=UPI00371BB477
MLNSARRTVICLLLALCALAAPSATAFAEGPQPTVRPCAQHDVCVGISQGPGTPAPGHTVPGGGGGGGDGVVPMCSWNGQQWPCWDDDLGWFSTNDGCYYIASDPQPPAGDPAWAGHQPSDGAVYEVNCRGTGGQLTPKPVQFFADPPVAARPLVRPRDLMNQVIDEWGFLPPVLRAAPGDTAVVGAPVWLWYDRTDRTYGDRTRSLSMGGLTVTVKATRTPVTWTVDDGSGSFTCADATTPYSKDLPASATAPCSHTFKVSSARARDQKFNLTARYDWHIEATRSDTGAEFADFNIRMEGAQIVSLRVAEVQVLN